MGLPSRRVTIALAIALSCGVAHAQPAQSLPVSERVAEVRVHGNASIADADVLRLAGVTLGEPIAADGVAAIRRRLQESGRFDVVDVRKRYRSLTESRDVALIIVVHERPGETGGSVLSRPFRRLGQHLMFLPILGYTDGYGLTYGARLGTVDLFGGGERLSAPLTWGATRRAALEVDRTIPRGPLDRVEASAGISSRENPRFRVDDTRVEVRARGERQLPGGVRLGAVIGRTHVTFGDLDERFWALTADAVLDTRNDPSFPRSGVIARASWTVLHPPARPSINQPRVDVRAFQPLFGQVVLAVRGAYSGANAPLPPYERVLLGGGALLRGYRAGTFDGDQQALASAELRIPLSSPLGGGRLGVKIFADAGAAYDYNQSLSRAPFHRGIGGGVFLSANVVSLNLDVARNDQRRTRAHFSFGFSF